MNQGIVTCHHGEQIVSGVERQTGGATKLLRHIRTEAFGGIQSCTHRSSPQGQRCQGGEAVFNPRPAKLELIAPGRNFVSKAKGHCILKVGPANFDNRKPSLGLVIKRVNQSLNSRKQ